MEYLVFDNKSDWEAYEALTYAAWIEDHPTPNEYAKQTTSWSSEQTRETDGKWIAPLCPAIEDHSAYSIEESADDWFPQEEIN